jgi:hypothetical protein
VLINQDLQHAIFIETALGNCHRCLAAWIELWHKAAIFLDWSPEVEQKNNPSLVEAPPSLAASQPRMLKRKARRNFAEYPSRRRTRVIQVGTGNSKEIPARQTLILCVRRQIACQKHQQRGDRCAFVSGNRHAAAGALGDDDGRRRAGNETDSNFRRQIQALSPLLIFPRFAGPGVAWRIA